MRIISMALCAGILLASGCRSVGDEPISGRSAVEAVYSVDELKRDFVQFRSIMDNKTARLYTDRDRLRKALNEAEAGLTRPMGELEFYRLLAPLVAELRCGHSFLSVSRGTERFMRDEALLFPLSVRILEDKLFVIRDGYGTGVAPGSELVSVNGRTATDIIRTLVSTVPTDGADRGRPRYDSERWFASMYYAYIDPAESFEVAYVAPGGTGLSEAKLPGARDPALAKTAKGVIFDTLGAPYSMTVHEQYAILRIPVFSYGDSRAYDKFLKDSFVEIAGRNLGTLILDVRGNYGGSPDITAELFKYLIREPTAFFSNDNPFYLARWKRPIAPAPEAFGGRLYVLMDEAGFSMSGFLLSLLKYHGIGTLVGAPSSGGYQCSDASMETTLRETGLRLRYSTQVFGTAVSGQEAGIGVQPDLRVDWTLQDYLGDGDPALAAALRSAGIRR
ncbi:MAG: hypothetical protein KKA67_09330 [Spirochaetes bacterium]|nr:hypothetical protein [Spirochaetota bacterium]MBU1081113.1 hypothetical protein [Spirochaetota bacterium]